MSDSIIHDIDVTIEICGSAVARAIGADYPFEPGDAAADEAPEQQKSSVLGWILLVVLVAYTYMIHQGIGPEPGRNESKVAGS